MKSTAPCWYMGCCVWFSPAHLGIISPWSQRAAKILSMQSSNFSEAAELHTICLHQPSKDPEFSCMTERLSSCYSAGFEAYAFIVEFRRVKADA